jgi:hypothetical protein
MAKPYGEAEYLLGKPPQIYSLASNTLGQDSTTPFAPNAIFGFI